MAPGARAAGAGALRILHVDSGGTFRGGQRQVALLAAAQRADPGLTVRVLAADARLVACLTEAGVTAQPWAGPTPGGLRRLAALSRGFAPHVLHAHDSRAHGALRLLGGRRALVVHRRIDDPPRDRWLTRWKYRRGRLICVSEAVGDVLRSHGIPDGRLHVVRSAVPIPDVPPERPPRDGPLRLLALGALVEHKGHDVLLEALARTRSGSCLVLAGTGHLLGRLARQVRALGLGDRVTLTGEAPPRFDACDLFVHPSRTEGLGTAVLDAMAAACPVLASRTGGLPEAVVHGETGWLVPPDEPEALAETLDLIGRQPPGELRRRGLAGWCRVRARHGIPAMVAGTRAVYDRALEGE